MTKSSKLFIAITAIPALILLLLPVIFASIQLFQKGRFRLYISVLIPILITQMDHGYYLGYIKSSLQATAN